MTTRPRPTMPNIAERGYQLLLLLYPPDHRAEYGYWMAQAFRDLCRDAYRDHGLIGLLEVWLRTFIDALLTAYQERRRTVNVFKPVALRGAWITLLGGVLLLIGAAAQSIVLIPFWQRWRYQSMSESLWWLIFPAILCLLFTYWQLYRQHAGRIGVWGRGLFNAATIFGSISLLMMVGLVVLKDPPGWWDAMMIPCILYVITLAIIGLENLHWKLLPRWNFLLLLVGLPMLLAILLQQFVGYVAIGQAADDLERLLYFLAYLVMGLASFVLGIVLTLAARVNAGRGSPSVNQG
ncbi:MAG: hypothetical protein KF726_03280 [Anaerolineae bacterium]|nr:hypothetical protein [Anaerolineae bacterium]